MKVVLKEQTNENVKLGELEPGQNFVFCDDNEISVRDRGVVWKKTNSSPPTDNKWPYCVRIMNGTLRGFSDTNNVIPIPPPEQPEPKYHLLGELAVADSFKLHDESENFAAHARFVKTNRVIVGESLCHLLQDGFSYLFPPDTKVIPVEMVATEV